MERSNRERNNGAHTQESNCPGAKVKTALGSVGKRQDGVMAVLQELADSARARRQPVPTAEEAEMQADINRILDRLDIEIPEAQKRMDELLARLRTTRIVVAA